MTGLALEDLPERAAAIPEPPPVVETPTRAEVEDGQPTRGRRGDVPLEAPEDAQDDAVSDAEERFARLRRAREELERRGQPKAPAPEPVVERRRVVRVSTSRGADGPVFEYYDDGRLKREGERRDGKREGLWIDYHRDGSRTEIEYRAGRKHGQEASWTHRGRPKFLGAWNSDTMTGTWTAWHANGVISVTREYLNGKLSGRMQTFHENGTLESESTFENGLDVATAYGWHDNGVLAWVMPYREGKREGKALWYDRDGRLASEGTYVNDGLDGVWTKYRQDGTVERTERWRRGVALGGK